MSPTNRLWQFADCRTLNTYGEVQTVKQEPAPESLPNVVRMAKGSTRFYPVACQIGGNPCGFNPDRLEFWLARGVIPYRP